MKVFRTHNYHEWVLGPLLLHFRNYSEVPQNFESPWGMSLFRTVVNNRCYKTLWYEGKRTYAIGWITSCPGENSNG